MLTMASIEPNWDWSEIKAKDIAKIMLDYT